MNAKRENTMVAALSGISGPNDVEAYVKCGVGTYFRSFYFAFQ